MSSYTYQGKVPVENIFVCAGVTGALAKLQNLFDRKTVFVMQDPAYPYPLADAVVSGRGGVWRADSTKYDNIVYLSVTPENHFSPSLDNIPQGSLLYICQPTNPTGIAWSRQDLESLVTAARRTGSLIICCTGWVAYVHNKKIPRSIFEIDGAKEVAIELGTFSMSFGLDPIRLGWVVVPNELRFSDGSSVKDAWSRLITSSEKWVSWLSQIGGIACFAPESVRYAENIRDTYLKNCALLKEALLAKGFEVYGGIDAPLLWVRMKEKNGDELFQYFLEKYQIVSLPGFIFGPSGKNFVRITGIGAKKDFQEAIRRLQL